jgi:hypothetical protein
MNIFTSEPFIHLFVYLNDLSQNKKYTMKKSLLLLAAVAAFQASAQDVQLVVESVDNQDLVPGHTYKVYAEMPSADYSLHAVFGNEEHPISIHSTAEFYQHPYGGNTSRDVSESVMSVAPELAYDSYLTIGRTGAANNDLWEVNIDFDPFNSSGSLSIPDGAWFLVPTSEQTKAGEANLILLMQFTTTGDVEGVLNLQGWTGDGEDKETWQLIGAEFNASTAEVFGCTDMTASNFNADATYDDGSCEGVNAPAGTINNNTVEADKGKTDWSIFPNPVINGQINIQFDRAINPNSTQDILVSIFEVTGKEILKRQIGAEEILAGNRIILNTNAAAGAYQVTIQQGDVVETQQIIIQ